MTTDQIVAAIVQICACLGLALIIPITASKKHYWLCGFFCALLWFSTMALIGRMFVYYLS